jgi:uncharacterized protein DUF4232
MARLARTAVGLVASMIVLAACAQPGVGGPGAGGPDTGQQAGNSPTPGGAGTTPADTPSTNQTTPAPAQVPRCHTDGLTATVVPGDSAAGHFGLKIVFTNATDHTCNMYGYPGVSFLTGPAGSQINQPAQRSTGEGGSVLVPLAPGGKAHADLLLVDTGNFPSSSCQPVTAAGIRIYPPDETQSMFVASAQQICSVNGVGLAAIYPVHTGA